MFTTNKFATGQSYDLKDVLINTTPFKTPFTNLLLGKTVEAGSPVMNWIEESIDEAAAVTLDEGADAPAVVDDTLSPMSNYCELIGATASVSNSAQASSAKGINDLLAHEVSKKTKAIKLKIEDRLINGTKQLTGTKYETAGILEQIDSGNKLTGDFTESSFLETLSKLYDAGVSDNMIVFLPASMKLRLNSFTSFQHFAKDKMAGVDVDVYVTPYGNARFALTEKLQNKLFVVNPDYLELGELIPFHAQVEPVSGSKQSIYMEWQGGVKLLNKKAGAILEDTTRDVLPSAEGEEEVKEAKTTKAK